MLTIDFVDEFPLEEDNSRGGAAGLPGLLELPAVFNGLSTVSDF
jgi:hypothetical protein